METLTQAKTIRMSIFSVLSLVLFSLYTKKLSDGCCEHRRDESVDSRERAREREERRALRCAYLTSGASYYLCALRNLECLMRNGYS